MISNRAVDKFFTTDEIVTYLKSDQNNFRIYPIGPLFGESRFAAFGLESIGGYHPAKLKIYNGEKHPHEIQKPKEIVFEKLNKRNILK